MHGEGVVEQGAGSVRFAGVFELLEEATKFLRLKAVVGSQVAPAVGSLDVMSQAVGVVEADGPGQQVLRTSGVFPAHHVGGDAGRIAEEGEVDELVDGLHVGPAVADGDLKIQVPGIDFGKGGIDPFFGLVQLDFGVADGVEVLLERLAVVAGELAIERVDVGDEEIKRTFAAGELVAGFLALGDKEEVKDLFGTAEGRDWAALLVEGRRVRRTWRAGSGIG